jgi:twinkle protein
LSDITELKRMLTDRIMTVCEYLLPRGVLAKRDWCVGSTGGETGQSLKICVSGTKVGRWADFAPGGESGGDLIDLWCIVKNVQIAEALIQIRDWLGIQAPTFESRTEKSYKRPAAPKCVKPKSAVLEYLTLGRCLTPRATEIYRVGENDRTIVWRYFLPDGTLAVIKYLGIDRKADGKKDINAAPDCEPVLFGWQAVPENAREIVITEGEIDAVTMFDYGFPALSVPFGGGGGAKQRWIESEYERLCRFEVIYLALDHDTEGEIAAEEIANRLGRHRCRRVKLPRKDANQCRQDGIETAQIEKCIAAASSLDPPELRRAGDFTDDVIGLFWPQGEIEKGYRLPFGKLRQKIVFRPGEMTIWAGATGAGKSQIISHASVAWGDQGARICIASLETKPPQLMRRMVKQAGNVDRPTEPFIREIMEWMNGWAWVFDLVGKSPIKRLLEVFEYARARYGCDIFVVDSLMRLGVGSEDYEGQERAVYQIVSWATANNVHVHLVAHSRKADRTATGVPGSEDIKGASEIGSNAFNILSVWRNKALEDEIKQFEDAVARHEPEADEKLQAIAGKPTVILNISKQRNGDFEGKCGLWFNQATYQYRSAEDSRSGVQFVSLQHELAAE